MLAATLPQMPVTAQLDLALAACPSPQLLHVWSQLVAATTQAPAAGPETKCVHIKSSGNHSSLPDSQRWDLEVLLKTLITPAASVDSSAAMLTKDHTVVDAVDHSA